MSRNKIFCVVIVLTLLGGLVPQIVTPMVTRADEAEVQETDKSGESTDISETSEGLEASKTQVNVGTFEELLAAFDATWEAESGEAEIILTQDIEQSYGKEDYLDVNKSWTVVLDLNGHTLTLRNDGQRGLINEGILIITGDGVIKNGDELNKAYGLIDNYGTLTIKNGTFLDYGQGSGSSIKNRDGVITIESAKVHAYGTAAGNACVYSDGVLTVYDGVEITNDATDASAGFGYGAYALIVNSGTATIGTTAGNVANPVRVNGNRGALGINSGTVTVNNGIYNGTLWYGIWITNNGDISDVTIKYAEANSNRYGVYAAVDDGKQDVSDAKVVIEDGKYSGGLRAAVAVNGSKSEHSFGMSISGGEYSIAPDDSYLAEGHEIYETGDETYPYAVDTTEVVNLPEVIYLTKGETYDIMDSINAAAAKYGSFSVSNVATLDGLVLKGVETGVGELNYTLKNAGGTVKVVVFESATADEDESESEVEASEIRNYVTRQVADLIKNGEEANSAVVLVSGAIDGVEYEGVELIKAALENGYALEAMMTSGLRDAEDWENADAYVEILAELDDEEAVAAVYDGAVLILAKKDETEVLLGMVLELDNPVTMSVEIPAEYLETEDGIERVFYVVRGHVAKDGTKVAERLDAVQSNEYLIFETDKFSTFAVTFVDIDVETGVIVPNTGVFTKAAETTTGFHSDYTGLISAIVGMSGMIAVVGLFKGYRRLQRKIYRGI